MLVVYSAYVAFQQGQCNFACVNANFARANFVLLCDLGGVEGSTSTCLMNKVVGGRILRESTLNCTLQ